MLGHLALIGEDIKNFGEVGVPLNDIGFTRGVAVCTAIEAYKGLLFHEEKHKKRLVESAGAARIPTDKARGFKKLFQNLSRLAVKNRFRESVTYVYVTGGPGSGGLKPRGRPNIYAFTVKEIRKNKPMAVATTHNYWRNLPGIKSAFYLPGYIALTDAGWPDDVIYIDHATNEVLESVTKNIFVVRRDAQLQTPPVHGKILNGITHQIFLGIAREEKEYRELSGPPVFPCVEETSVKFNDLIKDALSGEVTGVVLASTTTVAPVGSINGVKMPISQKTKNFCEQFLGYREAYYAKYK